MQFTMGGIHMFAIVRPEMSYGHIRDGLSQENTSVGQSNNKRTSIDIEATHLERDDKRHFKCE